MKYLAKVHPGQGRASTCPHAIREPLTRCVGRIVEPGTLNLRLSASPPWDRMRPLPESQDLYPARLSSLDGARAWEVAMLRRHETTQPAWLVEVIGPVNFRAELSLEDGDVVLLETP